MLKRGLPPVHPGEILREEFLIPSDITITELAAGIKIARTNLSHVINEKAGISTDLAIKLSYAFDISPQFWINLQSNYDLFFAAEKFKKSKLRIRKFKLAS